MSSIPPVGNEISFSRFEERVISQLHTMVSDNKSHHQYCETRFQNIKDQVEDVQYKIDQMFCRPND